MSTRKIFTLCGKLCVLALLVTFSFETFDVHGDVSAFEAMAIGFSFDSFTSFVLALFILAAYILSLLSLSRLDTKRESSMHIPIAIFWLLSGLLCLFTELEVEGMWWLSLVLSILASVFPILAAREEGEDEKLFTKAQVRTISRVVLLLVLLAFFQPVACGDSGWEIIGDMAFEFDDAIFVGAWLLIGIAAVAVVNALGHFVPSLDRGMSLSALSVILSVLLCLFFECLMVKEIGFGIYLDRLGVGYWNTLTLSILSYAMLRSDGKVDEAEDGGGVQADHSPGLGGPDGEDADVHGESEGE